MRTLFPEHSYKPWAFGRLQAEDWDSEATRKTYLTWLFKEMGMRSLLEWHNVTPVDLRRRAGDGLLKKFNNSVADLVISILKPNNTELEYCMFISSSKDWWKHKDNQRTYLRKFFESRNPPNDSSINPTPSTERWTNFWYNTSLSDIQSFGGGSCYA